MGRRRSRSCQVSHARPSGQVEILPCTVDLTGVSWGFALLAHSKCHYRASGYSVGINTSVPQGCQALPSTPARHVKAGTQAAQAVPASVSRPGPPTIHVRARKAWSLRALLSQPGRSSPLLRISTTFVVTSSPRRIPPLWPNSSIISQGPWWSPLRSSTRSWMRRLLSPVCDGYALVGALRSYPEERSDHPAHTPLTNTRLSALLSISRGS